MSISSDSIEHRRITRRCRQGLERKEIEKKDGGRETLLVLLVQLRDRSLKRYLLVRKRRPLTLYNASEAAFVYLRNNLVFLAKIVRIFRRMDVRRLRDLYDRARFKCARKARARSASPSEARETRTSS